MTQDVNSIENFRVVLDLPSQPLPSELAQSICVEYNCSEIPMMYITEEMIISVRFGKWFAKNSKME